MKDDFEEFLNDELSARLPGSAAVLTGLRKGFIETSRTDDGFVDDLLFFFDEVKQMYQYPMMYTARLNKMRIYGGFSKDELSRSDNWTRPTILIED